MSYLYVTENGATVSVGDNYINVKYSSDNSSVSTKHLLLGDVHPHKVCG